MKPQRKRYSVGVLYLLTMMIFTGLFSACFYSCDTSKKISEPHAEKGFNWDLEVYTNTNIYYIDFKKNIIKDEVWGNILYFDSSKDLKNYLSFATAEQNRASEIRLPEDYENINEDTDIFGRYDKETGVLTINFYEHQKD